MRKKAQKKIEVAVVEENRPAFLSAQDLLAVETMSRDVENAKLRMQVEEQALANMILEIKNLEHKARAQKELLIRKANEYEASKAKFTSYKSEMWPRYGLEPSAGLGYNPESGEIAKV